MRAAFALAFMHSPALTPAFASQQWRPPASPPRLSLVCHARKVPTAAVLPMQPFCCRAGSKCQGKGFLVRGSLWPRGLQQPQLCLDCFLLCCSLPYTLQATAGPPLPNDRRARRPPGASPPPSPNPPDPAGRARRPRPGLGLPTRMYGISGSQTSRAGGGVAILFVERVDAVDNLLRAVVFCRGGPSGGFGAVVFGGVQCRQGRCAGRGPGSAQSPRLCA